MIIKDDTEHKLQQSDVKGFPIVSNEQRRLLLGYIGRNELRYILGKQSPFIAGYQNGILHLHPYTLKIGRRDFTTHQDQHDVPSIANLPITIEKI